MNNAEKINQIKQTIKKLEKEVESLKSNDILVPDSVNIEYLGGYYGIWVGENHCLEGARNCGFRLNHRCNSRITQCKLVPCKMDDLKVGDLFYRTDDADDDFKNTELYGVYLGDGKYILHNGDITRPLGIKRSNWEHIYKVESV